MVAATVDHKQMVDSAIQAFRDRFDTALEVEGIDRATLARGLGFNGQQLVGNWRRRGRIGQESLPAVRALLPNTSMEWLNDGVGEAPTSARLRESAPGYGSQSVQHDSLILALQMVSEVLEGQGMTLAIPKRAAVTASVYALVDRGMPRAEIIQFIRAAVS